MKKQENPYQLSDTELSGQFETDLQKGLSHAQVNERIKKFGFNKLPEKAEKSWLGVFISQFQSPLIYILLVAAAIIFFVGPHRLDALIITVVLLFNAIIGSIQEGRTRMILRSLKRFIKADTFVVRDGRRKLVEDVKLVPGDLILLQEGQRVPADARLIESNNLQIDEALLTGESLSVRKIDTPIEQELPVADQRNMIFKGTYILAGSGKAIVVATGVSTEIGTIAATVTRVDTDMPLKRELDRMSHWILLIILFLCLFLFFVGALTGRPLQELLVMLTALFICVVPEGLPVVLTLALVSGVYRMAKQGILVKRMQAVEGLGRVDVIAIDKTGTLTRNEMLVTHVVANGTVCTVTGRGYYKEGELFCDNKKIETVSSASPIGQIATACALLDSSQIDFDKKRELFTIKGDPTEAAMGVFAQKFGFSREKIEKAYKKLYEIPFDSRLQYHAGFYKKHESENEGVVFIIGSAERLMQRAQAQTIAPHMHEALNKLFDEGLRVLAIAKKRFSVKEFAKEHAQHGHDYFACCKKIIADDLELLGLVGIEDSVRPEVHDVVERVRDAGIQVIMVTGDHEKTALHVAKKVGIFISGDEVIDGPEFQKSSGDEFLKRLDKITVYSRMTPRDKFRIITLFHKQGKLVAMTGDGVNDVPPLVAADLGIAMGSIGTEVAKEAADMILLKDSFVNIINAIKQSRHIFYTLRRVVLYFFATNMGELLIVMAALLADLPLPITAAQILWLNLVTDGFLDVALSTEPQEEGLLQKSWLERKMRLVDAGLFGKMLYVAIPMAIGSLWIFLNYYKLDLKLARTMTLLTMAMFQWFNAWNCRSETKSIFQLGFWTNKWLLLATSTVLFLQILLIYAPFMQAIFDTVPLSLEQWGLILAVSSPIIIWEEIRKFFVRRWLCKIQEVA